MLTEQRTQVDRRENDLELSRRKFIRRGKEFYFPMTAYLTDTNAFGNVYFAQYFQWQGKAREDFFKWLVPDYKSFLETGIKLITKSAHVDYEHECFVYDNITIKLVVGKIGKASVYLHFTYLVRERIVAKGWQKLTFADRNDKIIAFPELILKSLKLREII